MEKSCESACSLPQMETALKDLELNTSMNESGYSSVNNSIQQMTTSPEVNDSEDKDDDKAAISSKKGLTQEKRTQRFIKVKLDLDGRVHKCQTDGKESILDMIKKKLSYEKIKKPTQRMLFKMISKDCSLNLGLPTGVLDGNKVYECVYKEKLAKYNLDELVREFDVSKYDNSWDIKFFYVKFNKDRKNPPNVSPMSKIVGLLQVPFFNKVETIFQALVRDGRLPLKQKGELAIRKCCFNTCNEGEVVVAVVSLTDDASHYEGEYFEFYHSKATITEQVDPLPVPPWMYESLKPNPISSPAAESSSTNIHIKQEAIIPPVMAGRPQDEDKPVEQPAVTTSPITSWSKEDKIKAIEDTFGLDFQEKEGKKVAEKKRKEKIETFCCRKFALDYQHHILVEDMADLVNDVKRSVGAVIAIKTNNSGVTIETFQAGTAFMIGGQCVMTNAHVLNDIEKHGYKLGWMDFDYNGGTFLHLFFDGNIPVVKEEALDYAILKLKYDDRLPSSVIACGYEIALPNHNIDECISLIGHPNGYAKCIDPSCPIKPTSYDKNTSLYIRQHIIKKTAAYDVSTFKYGSSGSPGFIIRTRKVVVLHTQQVCETDGFKFEEGVLLSSIVQDIQDKIQNRCLQGVTIKELFGEKTARDFESSTAMVY